MKRIKVAQLGLGDIGLECLRLLSRKSWIEVTGAVENSIARLQQLEAEGRDEITDRPIFAGVEELLAKAPPDVVLHTAVSSAEDTAVQVMPLLRAGVSVVSSAEEMVFPYYRAADAARRMDHAARGHGARITGTGVNPGFVLDLLVICLTGVMQEVEAVHARRVVDASRRRRALQEKIGCCLARPEFERRVAEGTLGHRGLQESLCLVAHALGWKLDAVIEECEPVIATVETRSRYFGVPAGQVRGLEQVARGFRHGRAPIELHLHMALDAPAPGDRIEVLGRPPMLIELPGGVEGDGATAAVLVNTIPRLLRAAPGLCLASDLAVPAYA